ncbi:MAG TPA: hypothetical protein VKB05_21420 [Pyrinomonadaceae bacterium]|nr:hypothetical protein [Pyrinomonadaceae bacterium]
MYEPKPADPGEKPTGPCKCDDLNMEGIPDAKQPFRELLDALSEKVKTLATEPTEASTKFPDELKDIEKEYQGIDAIVAKYKEFYDKQLDCKLADVKRWRAKIKEWASTLDDTTMKCIERYRKEKYDDKENLICCRWIDLRRKLNYSSDCLVQARNKEARQQEAYDNLKGFLDTITKVFTDLEALFKKADAFNKEDKPKSAYAVGLEFEDLYKLIDWPGTDEEKCPKPNGGAGQSDPTTQSGGYATTPGSQSGGAYGQSQEPSSEGSSEGYDDSEQLKKKLSPTELRSRLIAALRELVLAKFHRFLLHHELLKNTANAEAAKKECDKFRADRQKLFLDLAEDIPCEKGSGGGGGGGGGEPQPSGGGGEYGQQQPPGGGYQQQQPPGGGQQQQPPSGGYEQQAPSGGYDKPPQGKPTGGYGKK